MSKPQQTLTTRQFAQKAGVSPATVSKWLREGKIQGRKDGGQWQVPIDQLSLLASESTASQPAGPKADLTGTAATPSQDSDKAYTLEEFSRMTYLTPYGVERWLKEGRLKGSHNAAGQWMVDGANLMKKEVRRLVRK